MEQIVISLRDVEFCYRPGERVLNRVSLQIGPGLTLLVGPNGCGKSTLVKILAGIERPDSGTAEIDGFDLWKQEVAARRNLAYVSEHPDVTPYATIREVIHFVCRLRLEPLEKGDATLVRAGLAFIADRSIREVSMGQRRRAVMAAAWIGSPNVVILDEPLETMDRIMRKEILLWINRLLTTGATVVIATHEIEPFVAEAIRVITVRGGTCRLIEPLPTDHQQRTTLLESISGGT